MRIAWFTPFSTKSAIGKCSQGITDQLSKNCEVDLWLFETENLLDTNLKKITFDCEKITSADLQDYDLLVYNMGNYLYFHLDIYRMAQRFKGVVILHDFIMHNFFTGYYFEFEKRPEHYIMEMERFYGQSGKQIAECSLDGKCPPIWSSEEVT